MNSFTNTPLHVEDHVTLTMSPGEVELVALAEGAELESRFTITVQLESSR